MQNIISIKDCYGCGMCASVCPINIITIELNEDGFYEPIIVRTDDCISCGLCLSVCSYIDEKLSLDRDKIESYAGWSKNSNVRHNCSSGGVAFEIGSYLIKSGYKGCGVRYNSQTSRAEHFITDNIEDFKATIGSKYIQSYTPIAFSQLNRGDKFFISGTPCQIDSLRRYIKKKKIEDNFILLDFFCHGVPSMLMWDKYLKVVKESVPNINTISWRNKIYGWHNSWAVSVNMSEDGVSDYYSLKSGGDMFYSLFLSNSCLGKACYDKCKYKMLDSSADIRVGDLWGSKYSENKEGVSGLLSYTERGHRILKSVDSIHLIKESISTICEGQMSKGAKRPKSYSVIFRTLKSRINISIIVFLNRSINKLCRIISKN